MKNCKKRNVSFYLRIFAIALVAMLTATSLWAKPKNAVEYTPFKSENPNATVFECEYIEGCTRLLLMCDTSGVGYGATEEFKKETAESPVTVYGWKKKKGGWENLGKYSLQQYYAQSILDSGSYIYTHYAVEVEVPKNSLTFEAKNDYPKMYLFLHLSKDYEKRYYEKQAAEEAERKRLEAEEKAKRNVQINAIAKEIAKGYVYHGIEEDARNCKLFASKALEEGHAYCISGFIVKYNGSYGAIEYADGFLFSSQSSAVSVEYINQKVKGEVVEAGLTSFFGKTLEVPLTVVVVGGKAPLHTPIVIGLIE